MFYLQTHCSLKEMKFPVQFFFLNLCLFLVRMRYGWSFQVCPDHERKALLDFKEGVIDPSHRLSSWEGEDCCKWHAVGCSNETGHVVKLDLSNSFPLYNMKLRYKEMQIDPITYYEKLEYMYSLYDKARLTVVKVNSSLLNLQHLSYLDLSGNNFSGMSIPKFFGSFPQLRYMNLSLSLFSGVVPPHLGNLSSLVSLDLSNTHYDYPFAQTVNQLNWVSTLSLLQYLDMSGLDLSDINTTVSLPSTLLELHLRYCSLPNFSLFLSHENFTSLLALDLHGNFIKSRIPDAIWNMTALEYLDLSFNDLNCNGDVLEGISNLRNLVKLDISSSSCSSPLPKSLSHLKNLKSLNLGDNLFHGPILASLENLTLVEELELSFNPLTGPIPTSLVTLLSLKILSLSYNHLSGQIPISLGNLSNLTSVDLSNNQLSGTVPGSLGQLSKLGELKLSANSLVGVLSEVHFAKLFELKDLDLSDNFLTIKVATDWEPPFRLTSLNLGKCKVGPQFPPWIRTQMNIVDLSISTANISGSVPVWFKSSYYPNLFSLDLSNNQIPKIMSEFLNSNSSLFRLDLSNNSIRGPLSENIGYMLPKIVILFLFNNQITGNIPKSVCKITNLGSIIMSNNQLSGPLPDCWSDLSHEVDINIDFSSNKLSGTIPASIGMLPQLVSLRLSRNNFHGELPSTLSQCRMLTFLDLGENKLSGQLPDWIGSVDDLTSLGVLRLRSNNFSGNISSNLCGLNDLRILDVAHNNLSGPIPHCFGNFPRMISNKTSPGYETIDIDLSGYDERLYLATKGREYEYTGIVGLMVIMDLSNNGFTGEIPVELTKLHGLKGLNLSHNLLTGHIPHNFGEMQSLESLDFSMNGLSGPIPESISKLFSLSYLNLSFNHLSGKIPSGNQLQSLSDPATIYMGNAGLCGLPLPNNCTGAETTHPPTNMTSQEEEGELNMSFFYIGMLCGIVVGFGGFCAVLFFKRSWKTAYFRFIDDCTQKVYDLLYVNR